MPGTYSLSAYSPEELYVRKHIIEETPDVIINVVDAGNLERNLYLTTQLIDMNVRMVVALNMYDALQHSGNKLNYHKLSELLGVPMVPTVSRTGEGIDNLFHVIIGLYEGADFMGQKEEIKNEILRDFREWHDAYVPGHKYEGAGEEDNFTAKGFIRHIHINHGPEIERSIDNVKREISKTRISVTNTLPVFWPSSCWKRQGYRDTRHRSPAQRSRNPGYQRQRSGAPA